MNLKYLVNTELGLDKVTNADSKNEKYTRVEMI